MANLELVALDAWGRDLDDATITPGGTWQVVDDPAAADATAEPAK